MKKQELDIPRSLQQEAVITSPSTGVITHLKTSLLIAAGCFLTLYASRIPAEHFADLSPFWPVTGIALAVLLYNAWYLLAIALGIVLWSINQGNPLNLSLLLPSTMIGPVLFWYFGGYKLSRKGIRSRSYPLVIIAAIFPSAIIGSIVYNMALSSFSFVDVFFVYAVADTLGFFIFYPVMEYLLKPEHKKEPVNLKLISLVSFFALVPGLFFYVGMPAYGKAASFLMFPVCIVFILNESRASMAMGLMIFSIINIFISGYYLHGVDQESQIVQLLEVSFWLITMLVISHILHESNSYRKSLLDKARYQATHNERSNKPNKRALKTIFEKEHVPFLSIVQIKNRDMVNHAYHQKEIELIESSVANLLEKQIPAVGLYHINEMRFALISNRGIKSYAESIQELEISLGETEVFLELGWGMIEVNGYDFTEALARANAALSLAYQQPVKRIYGPEDDGRIEKNLGQLAQYQTLVKAINNDGLKLYYQEILNLESGVPESAELLARIELDGRILNPGEFLPVFNTFDALSKLDRKVIEKAFVDFRQSPIGKLKRININVTAATLSDTSFIAWLEDLIEKQGRPAIEVCFEITEADYVRDWLVAQNSAQCLSDMGFKVAIDDFGTGFASFEYLDRFSSINMIKLDGAFVRQLPDCIRKQAVVRATLLIAESRGLDVCAEFVDSELTISMLKDAGAKYAQGYFIGEPRPVPVEVI